MTIQILEMMDLIIIKTILITALPTIIVCAMYIHKYGGTIIGSIVLGTFMAMLAEIVLVVGVGMIITLILIALAYALTHYVMTIALIAVFMLCRRQYCEI